MAEAQDRQSVLSQRIETAVRAQLGELQMQIIVLRQLLDLQTEQHPQPNPSPNPPPQPRDVPPQPTQPVPQPPPNQLPTEPPLEHRSMNGGSR